MMPIVEANKPNAELSWDQRLRRSAGRTKAALNPEYQELKFTLHRKLLDKINLEALASIDNLKLRNEVRSALMALLDGEQTLLSSLERQQISEEVLDEVFGLGPLEPLLQDASISDILVNTHRQGYVRRRGQLEITIVTFKADQHWLRIIAKMVSQWAGVWTNRLLWSMPGCRTARESTPSSRRLPWTVRCCRSAASEPTS